MEVRTARSVRACAGALFCAGVLATGAAQAQSYPSKPIEFVVHTAPGGGTDLFARAITEFMIKEKIFSRPIIVQNKPGGSGAIAFNYVKDKKGDGHTVLTMAT